MSGGNEQDDYRYEVFFSYRRDPESNEWHRRVKDQLHHWLKNSNDGGDGRIFFDTTEIKTGDIWVERLKHALLHSKTLVCIWSPDYFRSRYCRSEWMTFEARIAYLQTKYELERKEAVAAGKPEPKPPPSVSSLVVGASYHDGKRFPDRAKATQLMEFHDFANPMEAFWKTDDAARFITVLKKFADDVALKIAACPPFDERFPVLLDPLQDDPDPTIARPAGTRP
jgi:hypothetical protein